MSGYVKLYRDIADNELWLLEPFTKAQAWIDLFMSANWKDGVMNVRGNIVDINRGQIGWSELTMAKRWKWSRMKVRRFLLYLEKSGNIRQQKNNITTVITICNYSEYQGKEFDKETADETPSETAERQQKDSRRDTIEEVKEVKEVKEGKEIILDDDKKFFNMRELNAMAVKYLGWKPVITNGQREALRPLTKIFKSDVEWGFRSASENGASSVNYVIKVAGDAKCFDKSSFERAQLEFGGC